MSRHVALLSIVAFVVLGSLHHAVASPGDEPWKVGVSQAAQDNATKLFEQGNLFFEKHEYAKAVDVYLQAVAEWDHPQIHFNLMVALFSLARDVEAYEHVKAALKYGAAGLDKITFEKAQTYERTLAGRIVAFEVTTEQDGVQITFDGKLVQSGKGRSSLTTLPGSHALVATKDGFETVTKNLVLVAGRPVTESIELVPKLHATVVRNVVMRRRFRWWIPWTVTGAGVGGALIGTGLVVLGRSEQHRFQTELDQMFPNGVPADQVPSSLSSIHTHAQIENGIGVGLITAGSVVVIGGVVLAVLNQSHEVMAPPVVVSASSRDVSITWLGRF